MDDLSPLDRLVEAWEKNGGMVLFDCGRELAAVLSTIRAEDAIQSNEATVDFEYRCGTCGDSRLLCGNGHSYIPTGAVLSTIRAEEKCERCGGTGWEPPNGAALQPTERAEGDAPDSGEQAPMSAHAPVILGDVPLHPSAPTSIDEAFEEVRVTLNYLDQFRTLVPMSEDRDDALYALDLIRKRIEELEGALSELKAQFSREAGVADDGSTYAEPWWSLWLIARAALSTPSKEEG